MNAREKERRANEALELIREFSGELAFARSELDDALDGYEEGWEDQVMNTAIGLEMLISELLDQIEVATGERWVDLSKGELARDP